MHSGSFLHWRNLLEMDAYEDTRKHFYAAYGVQNSQKVVSPCVRAKFRQI
jgi:hypothetical protein